MIARQVCILLLVGFACADGANDTNDTDGANDYCTDDQLGSGTTETPVASGDYVFTTVLETCTLSADEAATCYGAAHVSAASLSSESRTITSNRIPNHDVDLFPNGGNPNAVSAQDLTWSVTTTPSRNATPTEVRTIGFGLNGLKFEPNTAEVYNDTQWRYEALTFAGRLDGDSNFNFGTSLGLDCSFAHVQPTGEYHYHGVPTGLMPETSARTLVGWAADGYPIFGRYGYAIPDDPTSGLVELTGSYRLPSGTRQALDDNDTPPGGAYDGTFIQDWRYETGLGDLDECNGRAESNEIDGIAYDYAYYLTYTYPFMPRCVWGTPGDGFGFGGR